MYGGRPSLAPTETPVCNELDMVGCRGSRRNCRCILWGTMGLSWDRTVLSLMLNLGGGYYCNLGWRARTFSFLCHVHPISIGLK